MPTLFSYRAHIGAVDQPFEAVRSGNLHFVVNALENQMRAGAHQSALGRVNQINVLRADHYVNRLIVAKALVHAGESGTEDFHQLIGGA